MFHTIVIILTLWITNPNTGKEQIIIRQAITETADICEVAAENVVTIAKQDKNVRAYAVGCFDIKGTPNGKKI